MCYQVYQPIFFPSPFVGPFNEELPCLVLPGHSDRSEVHRWELEACWYGRAVKFCPKLPGNLKAGNFKIAISTKCLHVSFNGCNYVQGFIHPKGLCRILRTTGISSLGGTKCYAMSFWDALSNQLTSVVRTLICQGVILRLMVVGSSTTKEVYLYLLCIIGPP